MTLKEICLTLLVVVAAVANYKAVEAASKYKVVCYLGSWANYRQGDGKFLIEDIDPFLCTHLIYGFAKLAGDKIAAYDPYLDLKENWGLGAFERFNNHKKRNPELKTLIAIGGWNEGSTKYSQMAANPSSRATFVKSVVEFCDKYDFDGLDMDWEYPANRGGAAADKQNFVQLLKELKEAFQPKGYLLTAAVAAGKATMDTAYDIPGVAKYLDLINVMAYDFHGSWEKQVGHNAPLYARPEESEAEKVLNVDYAIKYWIKNGARPEQVILGMGLYGRSFQLTDPAKHAIGSPSPAAGRAGPMTKEAGMLGYNEICLSVTKEGWQSVWVDGIDAPYAHKDNQWVGYDDEKSIRIKSEYVIKNNLGGGMVWSLETDDFRGQCTGVKYPLLSTIVQTLNGNVVRPTGNPQPVTKDNKQDHTSPPVVTKPPQEKKGHTCTADGYFRDQKNCSVFYQCVKSGNTFLQYEYDCGDGNAFDETTFTCNHRELIPGC